jgi:hypothetical protein
MIFQTFPKDFIDRNPQIFLNFEWINVPKLKIFIESKFNKCFAAVIETKCLDGIGKSFGSRLGVPVKTEGVATAIKIEPDLEAERHCYVRK